MAHHQNGFEHDYVLHCSPNYILIRDVFPHIHALFKQYRLEYEFQFR